MYTVGLTGGIGSGKSTVAKVFEVLGVPVFYADVESKRALSEDPEVRSKVIAAFGEGVYPDGVLDRNALRDIVFKRGNEAELARLNAISHPAVRAACSRWVESQHAPYVVVEAALLVDTRWNKSLDHLVVVSAPERVRIERVMHRDGASDADVRARLVHQLGEKERLAAADTVIVNDGDTLVLPQVLALHEVLLVKARD